MSDIKIGKASLLTTRTSNFVDEYNELQRLATEYQSTEIQRKLRIAEAVEAAFEWMSLTDAPNAPDENICLIDTGDLLKWYEGRNKE